MNNYNTDLEIIIPVYNEGATVLKVYEKLKTVLNNHITWRAFFIYDFFEDTSVPYLLELQNHDQHIVPLQQDFGRGVINALKFGFARVHDGAVAVVMGDDSDDLTTLLLMYDKFKDGAELVAASRYVAGGKYSGGAYIKKNLSKLAGWILSKTGLGTCDPTNNFKLYSGKFLKSVKIESTGGFEIALELTVKAALQGLKIYEVATIWRDREIGQSKFQLLRWLPHYLKWFFYYFKEKLCRSFNMSQK
jgi:dolichol-phosphate mannosyltransferase